MGCMVGFQDKAVEVIGSLIKENRLFFSGSLVLDGQLCVL